MVTTDATCPARRNPRRAILGVVPGLCPVRWDDAPLTGGACGDPTGRAAIMLRVATASAITTTAAPSSRRPNLVSVGTIVWLSSELMFFAALFAMYFTIRSVSLGQGKPWPTLPEDVHLDVPYALLNT